MIIHDVDQQSEEWFELRRGKMTASHAQEIANQGKGLETYIYKLMSSYYCIQEEERYTNSDLERGNILEPYAKETYTKETGRSIKDIGFVEIDEHLGFSPDGFIGKDGGIEVKCKNNVNHFKNILYGRKAIESKYIWQIQMNLLLSGRKWWDYVAYNPNFERNILIIRIVPDKEKFKMLKDGFKKGKQMIKEIVKLYKKGSNNF